MYQPLSPACTSTHAAFVKVPKQVGKKVTFKEEPIYQGYIYCHLKMNAEVRGPHPCAGKIEKCTII